MKVSKKINNIILFSIITIILAGLILSNSLDSKEEVNAVNDIFKKLETLYLEGELIEDISVISKLDNLERLTIINTSVRSLSASKNLKKLKDINVVTKNPFDVHFYFDIYYLKNLYQKYFG